MGISNSGNLQFDAAIQASFAQLQQDQAAAYGAYDNCLGAAPIATLQAALKAADIAHLRRCVAAANQFGSSPSNFIAGLVALGTGGV